MSNFGSSSSKDATKILIIEDEGEICLVVNLILGSKEIELDHVMNLEHAFEYLENEKPSIIILDNRLPDGYGVDFIRYIKRHYPGIPIIMISGYDSSVKDVAMENGADIFLEKPFTREQLQESIRELRN
jgi:two-component system, OmpR family, response regulator